MAHVLQVYIDRLKALLGEASQDPQSPAQRELHDLIVMRVSSLTRITSPSHMSPLSVSSLASSTVHLQLANFRPRMYFQNRKHHYDTLEVSHRWAVWKDAEKLGL